VNFNTPPEKKSGVAPAESRYDSNLKMMEKFIDSLISLGLDKLHKTEFDKYVSIVSSIRVVCSEIIRLQSKKEKIHEDIELLLLKLREYVRLSKEEREMCIFFQNLTHQTI